MFFGWEFLRYLLQKSFNRWICCPKSFFKVGYSHTVICFADRPTHWAWSTIKFTTYSESWLPGGSSQVVISAGDWYWCCASLVIEPLDHTHDACLRCSVVDLLLHFVHGKFCITRCSHSLPLIQGWQTWCPILVEKSKLPTNHKDF